MSTLVKLSQLVDLAVGSPEPGALNLNILHSVLHVVIRQLQIEDTQVEFRGADSDRMENCLAAASHSPQVRLSEYVLHENSSTDNREKGEEEVAEKEEKGGKNEKKASRESKKTKDGKKSTPASAEKASATTVIVVKNTTYDSDSDGGKSKTPKTPGTAGSARPSPTKLLEKKIIKLQTDMDAMINYQPPTNQVVLGSARTGQDQKPVAEMWEMMKFAKRMDAAEMGLTKLASLIEDVAKGTPSDGGAHANKTTPPAVTEWVRPDRGSNGEEGSSDVKRVDSIERRLWNIENRVGVAERRLSSVATGLNIRSSTDVVTDNKIGAGGGPGGGGSGGGSGSGSGGGGGSGAGAGAVAGGGGGGGKVGSGVNLDNLTPEQAMAALRDELTKLRQDLDKQHDATKDILKLSKKIPLGTLVDGVKNLEELRAKVGDFMTHVGGNPSNLVMQKDHDELLSAVNQSAEQLGKIDSSFNAQIESMKEQLASLEKEMGTLKERINAGVPASGETAVQASDFGDYSELYGKIKNMEANMEMFNSKATTLVEDKDEREIHIKTLIEQIELLKTLKADKGDLDEALEDKADQSLVSRKVSFDQFDTACDDLSKGLEEALLRLTQHELVLSGALEEVQREMDNKLDKMEISPLKDFVNHKLKLLQERLKTLAALRKETEAAGTKQKMLKNVNCLSCDKEVVMRTDDKGRQAPAECMPPNRSMRPYLTYELDAVRRQQRRLPGARNLNHFESAVQEQRGKLPCKDRVHMGKAVDHLCNRYCGGSHTTTTPQQRVTRTGHYLTQFGPEVIALDSSAMRPATTSGKVKSPRLSVAGHSAASKEAVPVRVTPAPRRDPAHKTSIAGTKLNGGTSPTETRRQSAKSMPGTPPPTAESLPESEPPTPTPVEGKTSSEEVEVVVVTSVEEQPAPIADVEEREEVVDVVEEAAPAEEMALVEEDGGAVAAVEEPPLEPSLEPVAEEQVEEEVIPQSEVASTEDAMPEE